MRWPSPEGSTPMGNTAFLPIAPEVILLLGAVLVLMAEVTLKAGRRAWAGLAAISLVGAAAFSWLQWLKVDDLVAEGSSQLFFSMDVPGATRLPMVVMDYFSAFGGMAIFTVAKGGLMYEASVSGQKFSYDPSD